jgi:hypothetical protein
MATNLNTLTIVKRPAPSGEEECQRKAEFDASMVMIRHRVRFADSSSAEYFLRELTRECKSLSRRFGLKVLQDDGG